MAESRFNRHRIKTNDNDDSSSDDDYTQKSATTLFQEYPFDSPLIGKYIQLKNVHNNDETVMYQIQSISSPTKMNNNGKNIPDLVQESTNQWLLNATYKCDNRRKKHLNLCNALIVIIIQILSYATLVYYLFDSYSTEITERAETCYGPHCTTDDTPCMDIKTGGVTALLLLGYLWADLINTFSMIVDSFNGVKLIKKSQFIGSIIILLELLSAALCGIFVGILSQSDFDAINGAVGILFVHDLDEKIYLAINVIENNWKRILALVLWIVLAFVIAITSTCVYHGSNGSLMWFESGACQENEFKCGDGQCIWYGYVCNGNIDCKNGNDENQNCNFSLIQCGNDMFRCENNGHCIPREKRCDGVLDCRDGSDESRAQNCSKEIDEINCGPPPQFERKYATGDWYLKVSEGGMFKCQNGQCIDGKYVCDGTIDCIDGSDEYPMFDSIYNWPQLRECPYSKLIECDIDEVLCKTNGKCIGKLRLCDGINDCPSGADERGCNWVWGNPWCEFLDKFQCGSKIAKIINDTTVLLFENETILRFSNSTEMLALMFEYAGGNGPCIEMKHRCDGIKDCKDGSDEELCQYFECNEDEFQCSNGQCLPDYWNCDHIPYCQNKQYDDKGFFTDRCDWNLNRTNMTCDEIVIGEISETGGYFNRYDIYIPCPYNAVQFTTCNEHTIGFNTIIQGWDENLDIHFESDDAEWLCDLNFFASTAILNNDTFVCNRTYTVMVGGRYQQESFGKYGFQVICDYTNFANI